jgi:hypothetical protein
MGSRPTENTIEALRLTIQQIEQTTDPSVDAQSVAELKRILLNRIAELEAVPALTGSESKNSRGTRAD